MSNSMTARSNRITSIDALRGFVIVLMALDHCRDFFGDVRINLENPETTNWAFFLTRWTTHFCAPTFVFLAGVSVWLYGNRIQSKRKLTQYLLSRGIWLWLLDLTVVYFALSLSSILPWVFIVLSAIGVSMCLMAIVCWLPTLAVLIIGLAIIVGHNLLDPITVESLGNGWGWLWHFVHQPGHVSHLNMNVGYPVLAWFGIMCFGYGIGPVFHQPVAIRRKTLITIGIVCVVCFFGVRFNNGYGCPKHWNLYQITPTGNETVPNAKSDEIDAKSNSGEVDGFQIEFSKTAFSFLASQKYPPSLAFTLMTLGPAILILVLMDYLSDSHFLKRIFLVFGKVPLFFYLIHFYLIHISSILTYWVVTGKPLSPFLELQSPQNSPPPEFVFQTLWQVYVAYFLVIAILYYPCKSYAKFKSTSNHPIWTYL
ncbi:MAG: heparan-alpha-glucosaminide N-acetyltransferase domain-containing protein [Planctomycetota bacterium]